MQHAMMDVRCLNDDMILLLLYRGANLSEKWGDGPGQ